MTISFTVPGVPVPKARARTVFQGGHVHSYTPKKTVEYERLIARHARKAMNTGGILLLPFKGALAVTVIFTLPRPKSHFRKGSLKSEMPKRPISRPDVDNYAKTLDALNGIIWVDDSQVVDLKSIKRYNDLPSQVGAWIEVTEL